jgi:hypothetical protein
MMAAAKAMEVIERTGGKRDKMTPEEQKIVDANGTMLGNIVAAVDRQQQIDTGELSRRLKDAGREDVKKLVVSGVYDSNHKLTTEDGKFSVIQRAAAITEAEASGDVKRFQELSQSQSEAIGYLSSEEALRYGSKLAGTEQGQNLLHLGATAKRLGKEMHGRGGGAKNVLNTELGLGLDAATLAKMSPEGIAAMAGVTDPKRVEDLQKALASGKMVKSAQALDALKHDEGYQEKHKADSTAEKEARDPFGAEQVRETKKTNTFLEALVTSNKDAASKLEKLVAARDSNPENKPP